MSDTTDPTDANDGGDADAASGGGDASLSDPSGMPPGAFLAPFPWWVAVTRHEPVGTEGAVRLGPGSGFLVLDAADGSTCLAVFTDEDLARRFVEASGFAGLPVSVETPRRFIALARHVPPVCTHAAFDPPPRVGGRARWVVPLEQVLTALDFAEPREGEDEPG